MIELTGLTDRQVELLDTIWSIDEVEVVHEYISSLSDSDQRDCQTLVHLIALELLDQSVGMMKTYPEVDKLLDKYSI